ncbi:MAG: arsenite efflux transporter metallochaperone ArsD [Hyphomicrobiales bacterium]|nr:arsenite efflux transporter metallochaperone ArsD [Hyphomicrobiales bacterium]
MTSLTIFDPAMCCSTGICGAEIDQKLVDFAADLDWLKSLGIDVKRINLSQEPTLFAENNLVKSVLEKSGVEGLPVIIAGDALKSSGQYPAREKLAEMAGLTPDQITSGSGIATISSGCCGGTSEQQKKSTSCC